MLTFLKKLNLGLSEKQKLVVLTGLAFFLRLVWMFCTDNALKGDAEARLDKLYYWIQTKNFGLFDVWPPVHFWLMQIFTWIFPHWIDAPRLLGVILGSALLLPLFYLIKKNFDSQIAWASTILYALGGLFIPISTVTMSEIPFIFFVLTAFYYLYLLLERAQLIDLVVFTICVCSFSLIRFEGWFLAVYFFALLFFKGRLPRKYISLSFIFLVFICFAYTYLIWRSSGKWFYWLQYNDFLVARMNSIDPTRFLYLEKIHKIFPAFYPSLLALALGSLVHFIFRKTKLIFIFFVLIVALPLIFKTLNHSMESFSRFYLLLSLIIIPLAFSGWKILCTQQKTLSTYIVLFLVALFEAYGSYNFGSHYYILAILLCTYLSWTILKSRPVALGLLIILLISSSLLRDARTYGRSFRHEDEIQASINWSLKNISQESVLLIEESSKLKNAHYLKSLKRHLDNNMTRFIWAAESITPEINKELENRLANQQAIYYVSFRENDSKQLFQERKKELHCNFQVIYSDNAVIIYQINPNYSK